MATPIISKPLYASLNSKPISDAARNFIEGLRRSIEFHERKTEERRYQRRHKKLAQFERALAGFLGDLLRAAASESAEGWVFRSLKGESFTGEPVSKRTFKSIVKALTETQLIVRVAGFQRWSRDPFEGDPNTPLVTEAQASRFKASGVLLGIAKDRGISPANHADHFILLLPERPIVLKAASRSHRGRKVSGHRMSFERDGRVEKLEDDVKRLNAFLDRFTIREGTHRGYVRVFNLGNQRGFKWNKGGRLYSQGEESYQRLNEAKRVSMTIDGEPVVEIDIKASYLTMLHGLLGQPFNPFNDDPYEVSGLKPLLSVGGDMRRWVVKRWAVATLGHHTHHGRWPTKIGKDFREKTGIKLGEAYPIRSVRRAMEAKHPLLKRWGELGISWADLMFTESEAVIRTMLQLMDDDRAPSLSVHDSLITREADREIAIKNLVAHYEALCGLKPGLEVLFNDGHVEQVH